MRWLITGCSSGLGLELARAVLEAGHEVIASSRNPSNTPGLVAEVERRGGHWIQLDVSAPDVDATVKKCIATFGPLDVLINNAGYAIGSVLEAISSEAVERQFETNVFGTVRTIQAVLPSMRANNGGTIVNVSSAEIWHAHPSISIYGASKAALQAMTESLQLEVSPFGIRVLLAVPGDMRTQFVSQDRMKTNTVEIPDAYKDTLAAQVFHFLVGMNGTQNGDPVRTAKVIVEEVIKPTMTKNGNGEQSPLVVMPLGNDSVSGMKARAAKLLQAVEAFEGRALACDFPE